MCVAGLCVALASNADDIGERQVGGHLEARAEVALAPAEHRCVDRQRDRRAARCDGVLEVRSGRLSVVQDVELRPLQKAGCRVGEVAVGVRGHRRGAHHGSLGRGGACDPHLARRGGRGAGTRRARRGPASAIAAPSTVVSVVTASDVDEHARPERPALERRTVRTERRLVAGAAGEERPRPRLDERLREPLVLVAVERGAHAASLSRAFSAISRSPPYDSRRGASSSGSQRASATSTRIASSISPIRPRPARRR